MRIEYVVVSPPPKLLDDCPVTLWDGGDWLEVADLAEARKRDLLDCNADKAALRRYVRAARDAFDRDD